MIIFLGALLRGLWRHLVDGPTFHLYPKRINALLIDLGFFQLKVAAALQKAIAQLPEV